MVEHPLVRRRRRPDTADARRRILDAASEQFARDGFDATPTAAIARQAGLTKGLLFYHFPAKMDILRSLLDERLPTAPWCQPAEVAEPGNLEGSLLRLHAGLGLERHESLVLRTIVFREAETHPEVGEHVQRLRASLNTLTEAVIAAAMLRPADPTALAQAARTWVAVLLDHANAQRFNAPSPDIVGAARIVAAGLLAVARRQGTPSDALA